MRTAVIWKLFRGLFEWTEKCLPQIMRVCCDTWQKERETERYAGLNDKHQSRTRVKRLMLMWQQEGAEAFLHLLWRRDFAPCCASFNWGQTVNYLAKCSSRNVTARDSSWCGWCRALVTDGGASSELLWWTCFEPSSLGFFLPWTHANEHDLSRQPSASTTSVSRGGGFCLFFSVRQCRGQMMSHRFYIRTRFWLHRGTLLRLKTCAGASESDRVFSDHGGGAWIRSSSATDELWHLSSTPSPDWCRNVGSHMSPAHTLAANARSRRSTRGTQDSCKRCGWCLHLRQRWTPLCLEYFGPSQELGTRLLRRLSAQGEQLTGVALKSVSDDEFLALGINNELVVVAAASNIEIIVKQIGVSVFECVYTRRASSFNEVVCCERVWDLLFAWFASVTRFRH